MDKKIQDLYLDDICQMVVDEDKIVTYKTLSRKLGIHVNTAKQLLHTFLSRQKSENAFPVSATYLIAGKLVDGTFNVTIVIDSSFESMHSKFVDVTSEHIYSVQKSKCVKDIKVLGGVSNALENSRSLVIKCSASLRKSGEETSKRTELHNNDKAKNEIKPLPRVDGEAKKLESLAPGADAVRSPIKPSFKVDAKKEQMSSKKPGLSHFFKNAEEKSKNEILKSLKKDEVGVTTVSQEKVNKLNKKEHKSQDKSQKKKKGHKRKRIQMYSDSEDSGSENDGNPSTAKILSFNEALEGSVAEPDESISKNKRKKRKMVDLTVMNEDGYLETKKEIVFETDSENDLDEKFSPLEEVKESVAVNEKDKEILGTHHVKKQSSLLNFFKKN